MTRLRLYVLMLFMGFGFVGTYAEARPLDIGFASSAQRAPARFTANAFLGFKSQSEMIKSFQSLWQVIKGVPNDAYRCAGKFVRGGWTGLVSRKSPEVMGPLAALFKERFAGIDLKKQMSFVNDHDVYIKGFDTDQGVCAGLTFETWQFSYLNIWDESGSHWLQTHPEWRLPNGHTSESWQELLQKTRNEHFSHHYTNNQILTAEAQMSSDEKVILDFYRPFIDRITLDEKVTIIPFFGDLQGFSSHPAITLALKQRAVDLWYGTNVDLTSVIEMLLGSQGRFNQLKVPEVHKLASEVKRYLDMDVSPIVFFTLPPLENNPNAHEKWIHVVRARSVKYSHSGDRLTLEIIDPNYLMPESIQQIEFRGLKTGKIRAYFTDYKAEQMDESQRRIIRSLSEVEIVPWMDWKASSMIKAWRDWLETHPEFAP